MDLFEILPTVWINTHHLQVSQQSAKVHNFLDIFKFELKALNLLLILRIESRSC